MNDQNINDLKELLLNTGFDQGLFTELEKNIRAGLPAFSLDYSKEFINRKVESKLNFSRNDDGGYSFNSYDTTLLKASGDDSEQKKQRFFLNKESPLTLQEAMNLLDGRAVYKVNLKNLQGNYYNAWLQLNFNEKNEYGNYNYRTFTTGYGYDLEKVLEKYPIMERNDPKALQEMIKSLQEGNQYAASFKIGNNIELRRIEANPQFKTLNLHDKDFKIIKNEFQQGKKALNQELPGQPEISPKHDDTRTQKVINGHDNIDAENSRKKGRRIS